MTKIRGPVSLDCELIVSRPEGSLIPHDTTDTTFEEVSLVKHCVYARYMP